MKVLELFAGSRSVGKACEELGYEVYSSDINSFPDIDYVAEYKEFYIDKVPFVPDILWASPPCTGFSVACIGRNWVQGEVFTPKTPSAQLGIELLEATLYIINVFKSITPNLIWYIENPRGKMRKAPHWDEIKHIRHTVSYCKYGDDRMKPTDIWTNNLNWQPKPMCKPFKYDYSSNPEGEVIDRHCHHDASPRGTQTGGTQKLKGNHERSKIPHQLCIEILKQWSL